MNENEKILKVKINWSEGNSRITDLWVNKYYHTHMHFDVCMRALTSDAPDPDGSNGYQKVSLTLVLESKDGKCREVTPHRFEMYKRQGSPFNATDWKRVI